MAMNDARKTQFQDRLKRISAGGPNTMGQVYVGPPDISAGRKNGKKRKLSDRDALDNVLYPLSLIGAFIIGTISIVLARLARYHLFGSGLTGENADLWLIIDGIVAMGIVISLRSVFRSKGKTLEAAKALGIVAMALTMHNFVHLNPNLFNTIFSPEWTAQVTAATKENSLLIQGKDPLIATLQKPGAVLPD